MKLITKVSSALLIIALLLSQAGCTKEKAEALKSAAEQFRVESDATFEKVSGMLTESVTVTSQSKEEELKFVVDQLNKRPGRTDQQMLTFANEVLAGTNSLSKAAVKNIDGEFGKLSEEYELFASMFRSLPKGYLFAKNDVVRAEKHSIRLTMRLVKMAKELDTNPITNESKRADLVIKLLNADKIPTGNAAEVTAKNLEFTLIAQQLMDLRDAENKANSEAIIQCLKAAEAGKTVTELIHNYSKFTVTDMLNTIKDSLNTINAVTGDSNPRIKTLIGKYNTFVTTKVATDPLWSDVLNADFGGNF